MRALSPLLEAYGPILIFIGMAIVMDVLPLLVGQLVRPNAPDDEKLSTYECGFEPFEDPRSPFDVRFYLVAILFIIFDLETAFLFPWAVALKHIGWAGMSAMGVFLGLLIVGFIYEWRRGALEWE